MLVDDNKLVKLNPTPYGMQTECNVYNQESINIMRKWNAHRVLRVSINQQEKFWGKLGFMTCVDVVQYILGTKFKRCLTPFQLYKKLLQCDSSKVFVTVIR